MPRLWSETIESHRREVRDAVLDTVAALVARDGLLSVTMSQIAEEAGIGRATLYKYFPDVEAMLAAWHERQIAGHLQQLARARDETEGELERLRGVLEAYALIIRETRSHRETELAAHLHRDGHAAQAEQHLCSLFRGVLADAVRSGDVREDISVEELVNFCLHALTAAGTLPSKSAVLRLVELTMSALRPSSSGMIRASRG